MKEMKYSKEIYEEVRHACYQIQKIGGEAKDEMYR
jgi:hypothetical protein